MCLCLFCPFLTVSADLSGKRAVLTSELTIGTGNNDEKHRFFRGCFKGRSRSFCLFLHFPAGMTLSCREYPNPRENTGETHLHTTAENIKKLMKKKVVISGLKLEVP